MKNVIMCVVFFAFGYALCHFGIKKTVDKIKSLIPTMEPSVSEGGGNA